MNTRPARVPNIPPHDALYELRQIIDPTTPQAKQERREFIRDELAKIGNEIDKPKPR